MFRVSPIQAALLVGLLVSGQLPPLHPAQPKPGDTHGEDDFLQRIEVLELHEESIFNAIARLSATVDVSFSIERIIDTRKAALAGKDPVFTGKVERKPLRDVLNWLCSLDTRYTWVPDRNTNSVNILPRASLEEENYLLNKVLPTLILSSAKDAEAAVFQIVGQLGLPQEQVAFFQPGGSVTFAQPWTATFTNITVREAFNQTARQLGPTHGWQFTGTEEFRLVMFHTRLQPRPRPGEKQEEPFVRPEQ